MTSDQFVFWLQGYLELSQHLNGPKDLNERQVEEIKSHLDLVLTKVTPNLPTQLPLFPSPYLLFLTDANTSLKRQSHCLQSAQTWAPANCPTNDKDNQTIRPRACEAQTQKTACEWH